MLSVTCYQKVESCCHCGQGVTDDSVDLGKAVKLYWWGCGGLWSATASERNGCSSADWYCELLPPAAAKSRVRVILNIR